MTDFDPRLVDHLSTRLPEFRRLLDRHRDYEQRVRSLQGNRWLSTEEQREIKRLKRLKLAGRDRMAALIAKHTESAEA